MFRNDDGEWVTEQEPLKDLVIQYYRDLYAAGNGDRVPLGLLNQPIISNVDSQALVRDISFNEVRVAFFQIQPWKVPGINGLKAGFSQECWQNVGQDLVNLVQSAFATGFFKLEFESNSNCFNSEGGKSGVCEAIPAYQLVYCCL